MVREAIEKKSSLSSVKRVLYSVFFHPDNKASLDEITKMSIEQFLDYQEALSSFQMIKSAAYKDEEHRSQIQTQPNRKR